MKKINELIDCFYDINIYGITDDSREVKSGYLFVATKGYNVDHFDYIDDAIKNGCVFIISDRKIDKNIPHLVVDKDLNDVYIELCRKFYDVSFENLKIIGITGTDGKTTTSYIVKQILNNCAYLGTNGLELDNLSYQTDNTTPCINEFYRLLKIICDNNSKFLSMEVSSEALLHKRIKHVPFSIVGITNITGDHLNVHKSFEDYVKCKKDILNYLDSCGYAVVNGDDCYLKSINQNNVIKFGYDKNNDYVITDDYFSDNFTHINVVNCGKKIEIISPYRGKFNVYNVVMAFIIARLSGVFDNLIIDSIKNLKPIKGRCEFLDFGQDFDILLDYAHTINGVKSIFSNFNHYSKVITVIGCAGGRDREKRPVIGNTVISNSDVSIFTMDDPRFENIDDIIDEMVGDSSDYIRILDRKEAIKYALSIASKDSIVLILGKGRDNYMAIGDKKISYCDYDVVKDFFCD